RVDRLDIADPAKEVHRHDGLRPRRDGGRHRLRDDHAHLIAVDQHRPGADREDGAHRRDEGVCLGDDLVAGADGGGAQRQLESGEPGVRADRLGDPAIGGELALECRDVRAEDEVSPLKHGHHRLADGRLQRLRLRRQVHEPDALGDGAQWYFSWTRRSSDSRSPMTRAGLPATTMPAGTSLVTTAAAPTRAPSPTTTSGSSVALMPTRAPRLIVGPRMHSRQMGWRSLAIITPGARKTSSSRVVNWAT